jgi:hypothetical protein
MRAAVKLLSCGANLISQLAKRDEPLRRFIPQHETHASEALPQREPADLGEIGVLA